MIALKAMSALSDEQVAKMNDQKRIMKNDLIDIKNLYIDLYIKIELGYMLNIYNLYNTFLRFINDGHKFKSTNHMKLIFNDIFEQFCDYKKNESKDQTKICIRTLLENIVSNKGLGLNGQRLHDSKLLFPYYFEKFHEGLNNFINSYIECKIEEKYGPVERKVKSEGCFIIRKKKQNEENLIQQNQVNPIQDQNQTQDQNQDIKIKKQENPIDINGNDGKEQITKKRKQSGEGYIAIVQPNQNTALNTDIKKKILGNQTQEQDSIQEKEEFEKRYYSFVFK